METNFAMEKNEGRNPRGLGDRSVVMLKQVDKILVVFKIQHLQF